MAGDLDADLLASGKAFADLSDWRKLAVSGATAVTWLNGCMSEDMSGLAPGRARRGWLLSGDGELVARVTVAVPGGMLLLLQDPEEPGSMGAALSGRALPHGLEVDDRTRDLALFSFPGRAAPPTAPGTAFSAPSCVGHGVDVFCMMEDRGRVHGLLSAVFRLASRDDLRAWQARVGDPV